MGRKTPKMGKCGKRQLMIINESIRRALISGGLDEVPVPPPPLSRRVFGEILGQKLAILGLTEGRKRAERTGSEREGDGSE